MGILNSSTSLLTQANTCRKSPLMKSVKSTLWLLLACTALVAVGQEKNGAPERLISWLLEDKDGFRDIPFPTVIKAATGKQVVPVDVKEESQRELISKIGGAAAEVIRRMNATNSAAQQERRINEVSSHFEDEFKRALNAVPGFACDFPRTSEGKLQRSGYPDLRLEDKKTGRIVYLDPKLYEAESRASTFRTFYFEPKADTGKIHDDAIHLIVGFEHTGKAGAWKFTNWELVDLSRFRVRLKAEFQGSNRDLYRDEAIVGTSRK
jgi:hypothetical protein